MSLKYSKFKVSVIIPVYNAAKYLRKAVESAVHLDEVGEIILIEDCSPDNALEICKQLKIEYSKVKLYRHPNGENRGAGASRNLGIEKSVFPYIAFLDADDYYLDNRFKLDKRKFAEGKIDGVYNAVLTINTYQKKPDKLYTISRNIKPNMLLHYLIRGTYGHFHTNGITLKRELLRSLNGFKTNLPLHQDSELWLRCAIKGTLVAGCIRKPTAVVVTHGNNRIIHWSKESKLKYHLSLLGDITLPESGFVNYLLMIRSALSCTSNMEDIFKVFKSLKFYRL